MYGIGYLSGLSDGISSLSGMLSSPGISGEINGISIVNGILSGKGKLVGTINIGSGMGESKMKYWTGTEWKSINTLIIYK